MSTPHAGHIPTAPVAVRRVGWVSIAALSVVGFGVASWLVAMAFVGAGRSVAWVAASLHVPESLVVPAAIVLVLAAIALAGISDRTLRRRAAQTAQDRSARA